MEKLKAQVLATAIAMNDSGINTGSAGNVSARFGSGLIITPTGMPYADCDVADMVALGGDGRPSVGAGTTASPQRQPSSEWRFHRDIYAWHPDAGAVVHAHSPFATALACQGISIPAFHYMVARFGGNNVPCAAYATFGSQELSDTILAALSDRCACLMANHGMVVYGKNLKQALALAIELESLAEQYWRVIQLGPPVLLSDDEMARVLSKFAQYGQQT
jgi:L-fuculose-phosphate aldolase